MKLSDVKQLFEKELSAKTFNEKILNEIEVYKKSLKIKGKSATLFLTEDISVNICVKEIKFLCDIFLDGIIDNWTINYISESLLLSNNVIFENEIVKEALFDLTDPEFGLKLTHEYVKEIQRTLA